jgi:hypothetical protein
MWTFCCLLQSGIEEVKVNDGRQTNMTDAQGVAPLPPDPTATLRLAVSPSAARSRDK